MKEYLQMVCVEASMLEPFETNLAQAHHMQKLANCLISLGLINKLD